jgi:hypothetical protein
VKREIFNRKEVRRMPKFVISACGIETLATKEIEAATKEEAIAEYEELWERGLVEALDYEFDHFTVTNEDGSDEIVKE